MEVKSPQHLKFPPIFPLLAHGAGGKEAASRRSCTNLGDLTQLLYPHISVMQSQMGGLCLAIMGDLASLLLDQATICFTQMKLN